MVSEENRRLVFRTQRLALRAVTQDDFQMICRMEHPDDNGESALERTTALHQKLLDKNRLHLLVFLLPDDKQLLPQPGQSSFPPISWEDANSGTPIGNAGMMANYEIGYMVGSQFRNRGYASEAVAGVLAQAWRLHDAGLLGSFPIDDRTGRPYVAAKVDPENISSIRVLRKAGAVEEGESKPVDRPAADAEGEDLEQRPLKLFRMYRPE